MAAEGNTVDHSPVYMITSSERIVFAMIHWTVVLVIVAATVVLALQHAINGSSATAILGGALGHAGTAGARQLQNRSQDRTTVYDGR